MDKEEWDTLKEDGSGSAIKTNENNKETKAIISNGNDNIIEDNYET